MRRRRQRQADVEKVTAYTSSIIDISPPSTITHPPVSEKSAARESELSRLENVMAGVRRQHNHSREPPTISASVMPPSTPTSAGGGGIAKSELATQIAESRLEVADLRRRPSSVGILDISVPPPQYQTHNN